MMHTGVKQAGDGWAEVAEAIISLLGDSATHVKIPAKTCSNNLAADQLALGNATGVNATPAIALSDDTLMMGIAKPVNSKKYWVCDERF